MADALRKAYDLMRERDMRMTKPRQIVLDILSKSNKPLSVMDIRVASQNQVDLVTIYRILETFEEYSVIRSAHYGQRHALYELIDGEEELTYRIRCNAPTGSKKNKKETCGHTEVIKVDVLEDAKKQTNFIVTGHSIEFVGICPKCQKKNAKKSPKATEEAEA